MTRSPAAIMPKSAMALPTAPRSRAARRSRVREGRTPAGVTSLFGRSCIPRSVRSGGRDVRGALEILCLDVTDEGSGRQGLAGGAPQEVLHRHLGPEAVHLGAEPAEEPGELARRELLIEDGHLCAQALVELRGDDGAERIGGEVAERAHRPVNVLQASLEVVGGADRQAALHAGVPGFGEIAYRKPAREQLLLEL